MNNNNNSSRKESLKSMISNINNFYNVNLDYNLINDIEITTNQNNNHLIVKENKLFLDITPKKTKPFNHLEMLCYSELLKLCNDHSDLVKIDKIVLKNLNDAKIWREKYTSLY